MRACGCSCCYLNNNMESCCWTEKHGSLATVKPRSEEAFPFRDHGFPFSPALTGLTPTALKEAGGERKDGGNHGPDGNAGTDVGRLADANCCAKQFAKCVSPRRTLKGWIYGQNVGMLAPPHITTVGWSGRGMALTGRELSVVYTKPVHSTISSFCIFNCKKKVKMMLCSSLYFFPNTFLQ